MTEVAKPQGSRTLLVIAFFSFIIIGIIPGLLNIAWAHMQDTFALSLDSLGVLLGAAVIGRLFIAFTSGRFINSFGLGVYLVAGSIIATIGTLGVAISPTWGVLLVVYGLVGMGDGLIDAGMNNYVATHYGSGPMNWLHSFFGIGLVLGPIYVTFVINQVDSNWSLAYAASTLLQIDYITPIVEQAGQGWRVAYGSIVILQVILIATLVITLKQWRLFEEPEQDQQADVPKKAASFIETLKTPTVILGMLLFLFFAGVEAGTGQLANTLFSESRGIDEAVVAGWISFYWLSFTGSRMFLGTFGNKIPNILLTRIGLIGCIIGLALMWLNITQLLAFLGMALVGLSVAPIFITLTSETPRRVGRRHTANTIGFQIGFAGVGIALVPGLAGFIAENTTLEVIPLVLLASGICAFLLHEFILLREGRRITPQVVPTAPSTGD